MHTTESLHLAPGVYLACQEDITRLLDLDRGRFYGLDAIASEMLTRTLRDGPDAATQAIASACNVDEDLVRHDLEELFCDLRRRHLLTGAGRARPGRRWLPRWLAGPCRLDGPLTAGLAGRLLRRAWWSLRLEGWAGSLERWRHPAGRGRPVAVETSEAVIRTVDALVRDAAAAQLLPVACKERALVGHHLLRAVHGLPSVLIVGVQHYPFTAHAWVEIDGQIVTDDPGHCTEFVPVARFT